jgi:hypothetical protein
MPSLFLRFLSEEEDPFWGPVISSYSRKEAIDDCVLVDVSDMAKEAGFKWPVAVTREVWEECVAWSEADTKRQTVQDEKGRLWDVLWLAHLRIRLAKSPGTEAKFPLYVVPRGGKARTPKKVILKLVTGPGDDGEPVVTIMLPGQS